MKPTLPFDPELEEMIDRFEAARQESSHVDVADYFPARHHPQFDALALELLRVDMEYAWTDGQRSLVRSYCQRFPDLLSTPDRLSPLAFEEYRLRRDAGEIVDRHDYAREFGLNVDAWRELTPGSESADNGSREAAENWPASTSMSASRLSHTESPMPGQSIRHPRPGERMAGFDFVAEIGHGAFSRVYLAQQNSLANRFVVLKLSSQRWAEADLLARLQHANVVPIYSVHRREGLQMVCMPFLGFCTLADVLRNLFPPQPGDMSQPPASGAVWLSTVAHHRTETLVGSFAEPALREQIERQQTVSAGHANHLNQQLQSCSYVEACLWMMTEVADGLDHAHEAGILHRDLKPANILITDDGRPMLLDFNLSEDLTDLRNIDTAIGGTLAYMAPEHLRALVGCGLADHRSDLYSLGIILFEMLTGSRPFPDRKGIVEQIVLDMIDDRQRLLSQLSTRLARTSPAVQSIVAKLLAFDPQDRYQSASELREDLRRHLHHQTLRYAPNHSVQERLAKWSRRHPRLSSFSTMAAVGLLGASLLGSVWIARENRHAQLAAREHFEQFEHAYHDARLALSAPDVDRSLLDEAIRQTENALKVYPVQQAETLRASAEYSRLPPESQARMLEQLSELEYRLAILHQRRARGLNGEARRQALQEAVAWNQRAAEWNSIPAEALQHQREQVAWDQRTNHDPPIRMVASIVNWPFARRTASTQPVPSTETTGSKYGRTSAATKPNTLRFHQAYLSALASLEDGRYETSRDWLEQAIELQPQDFSAWFAKGQSSLALQDLATAITEFTVCTTLNSKSWLPWFHRGLTYYEMKRFEEAANDFSRAIDRRPDVASIWINRALCRKEQHQWQAALDDLRQATAQGASDTRIHFIRAEILQELGREEEAKAEREFGLKATPQDELSWIARGMAQLPSAPEAALNDLQEALRIQPLSYLALRNASHVLSDYLKRNDDAIQLLDQLLEMRPNDYEMRAARGVLHARAGHLQEAHQDASSTLEKSRDARTQIHVACIYALLAAQDPAMESQAVRLIQQGLALDPNWATVVSRDADLRSLRTNPQFQQCVSSGLKLISHGPQRQE